MPYLEVKKVEEEESISTRMPNVIGLTLSEAKEALEGFEIEVQSTELESSENVSKATDKLVYKQIPEEGVTIESGSKVILYCD